MIELTLFPTHYQGEATRQNIINFLDVNNGSTVNEIAKGIKKSVVQTRRHLNKLSSVGAITRSKHLYYITSKAFSTNLTTYWD